MTVVFFERVFYNIVAADCKAFMESIKVLLSCVEKKSFQKGRSFPREDGWKGMGMKERVVVGMSGGVDSSVAAYLLKEQGYDVVGVTMQLWQECGGVSLSGKEEAGCGWKTVEDAGAVAQVLGIPHYVVDFRERFSCCVKDYFVEEYLRGHTPNPCIVCNRRIKWEALLQWSLELGAQYIATGHYARVVKLPNGRFSLRSSVSSDKDQTYVLYSLTQEQLSRTLMPLGEYEKSRIRAIAREAGLPVAQKPDSQEICFVPDDDYGGFIDRAAGERVPGPGNFVDEEGKVLGRHRGITHYTIGQRRGLGLPMGERVYVTQIRPAANEVVVGREEALFAREICCGQVNFMGVEDLEAPVRAFAKIRYRHKGEYCRVKKTEDGGLRACFEKPVRAPAPGQSVCFYLDDYVLGGGVIVSARGAFLQGS